MKLLDPTHSDDPRFDPHGEQGRRVYAAATKTPARRRRRLIALAATAVLCAVAAIVLTLAGSPLDARDALARSVERMREIDSGRIIYSTGGNREEVRFSGEDMQWISALGEWRLVDGVEYFKPKNGDRFQATGTRVTENSFPHKLVAQVGKQSIVALAERARDLTTRELPGGGFEYRATTTAGEVFDALPIAAGRAQGGAWRERVPLEITVEGGLIRRVRAGEQVTEYSSLGEPQSIELRRSYR